MGAEINNTQNLNHTTWKQNLEKFKEFIQTVTFGEMIMQSCDRIDLESFACFSCDLRHVYALRTSSVINIDKPYYQRR